MNPCGLSLGRTRILRPELGKFRPRHRHRSRPPERRRARPPAREGGEGARCPASWQLPAEQSSRRYPCFPQGMSQGCLCTMWTHFVTRPVDTEAVVPACLVSSETAVDALSQISHLALSAWMEFGSVTFSASLSTIRSWWFTGGAGMAILSTSLLTTEERRVVRAGRHPCLRNRRCGQLEPRRKAARAIQVDRQPPLGEAGGQPGWAASQPDDAWHQSHRGGGRSSSGAPSGSLPISRRPVAP